MTTIRSIGHTGGIAVAAAAGMATIVLLAQLIASLLIAIGEYLLR